jgi:NADH-quinone oxidoreductase subunit L
VEHHLWLIPVLPLLGAIINGGLSLGGASGPNGPNRGMVGFIAVLMPALAFALTVAATVQLAQMPSNAVLHQHLWTWFQFGSLNLGLGLLFDHLSSLMLLFVTGIGTLIHLYSVGYMAGDRGFARFMAYLNLFMFAMITLVIGDSLPATFLGWEGVGLCSYLLIGFWHKTEEYNDAARKAFVVNRVGDLGFLLGGFALLAVAGGLDYQTITAFFAKENADSLATAGKAGMTAAAALLIFFGCTGKSAQIPLVTWLPDAMAGPTPVSALIHAATMVTAGVYLVARLGGLFADATLPVLGLSALQWVMVVGAITAVWGAVAGFFQHDIKKALAYSTVSQLGFMFMACGAGRYDIALFHVFTHAFFKATLFLGSGAVIHGLHHEQDMRRMGGLAKLMPFTFVVMAVGWLAILGIAPFSGFWSKDLILESLFAKGGLGIVIGVVAVLTAAATAYYMTRMMVLTFFAPSRVDDETKAHIHGPPLTMAIPLVILAIGSAVAGFAWMGLPAAHGAHTNWFEAWLAPAVGQAQSAALGVHAVAEHAGEAAHHGSHVVLAWIMAGVGTLAAVVGGAIGWTMWKGGYRDAKPEHGTSTAPTGFGGSWTYGFDRLYDWTIVLPVKAIGLLGYWIVELFAIAGLTQLVAMGVNYVAEGYAAIQRSRLRSQLALSMAGLVVILVVIAYHLPKG